MRRIRCDHGLLLGTHLRNLFFPWDPKYSRKKKWEAIPLTPFGIFLKSSLPRAFWFALNVQLSVPVHWRSPLEENTDNKMLRVTSRQFNTSKPSCNAIWDERWDFETLWLPFSCFRGCDSHVLRRRVRNKLVNESQPQYRLAACQRDIFATGLQKPRRQVGTMLSFYQVTTRLPLNVSGARVRNRLDSTHRLSKNVNTTMVVWIEQPRLRKHDHVGQYLTRRAFVHTNMELVQ